MDAEKMFIRFGMTRVKRYANYKGGKGQVQDAQGVSGAKKGLLAAAGKVEGDG